MSTVYIDSRGDLMPMVTRKTPKGKKTTKKGSKKKGY